MALCTLFLTAALLPAVAAPAGPYVYHVAATNCPVWDVSGEYHLSPTVAGDTEVEFMIDVAEDGRGSLSGAGTTDVRINGELVQGEYSVKGKVFRAGPVTKVSAVVKLAGSGVFQGQQRSYSLVATYALQVDPVTRRLTGVGRGGARASGLGAGTLRDSVDLDIPADRTGDWDLRLDVATNGKVVTGTAQAVLSNGRLIDFTVKGLYSDKTGKSLLNLAGVSPNITNKLKLTATGDDLQLTKLRGLVLGQVVAE